MAEMSARSRRRAELHASLEGLDPPPPALPDPQPAVLPQRTPGVHRFADPDTDVEYLLCDGGFTEFLTAAAAISDRRRRDELAP